MQCRLARRRNLRCTEVQWYIDRELGSSLEQSPVLISAASAHLFHLLAPKREKFRRSHLRKRAPLLLLKFAGPVRTPTCYRQCLRFAHFHPLVCVIFSSLFLCLCWDSVWIDVCCHCVLAIKPSPSFIFYPQNRGLFPYLITNPLITASSPTHFLTCMLPGFFVALISVSLRGKKNSY